MNRLLLVQEAGLEAGKGNIPDPDLEDGLGRLIQALGRDLILALKGVDRDREVQKAGHEVGQDLETGNRGLALINPKRQRRQLLH